MMAQTEKTLADFTPIDATSVTLHTSKGDITFDIYTDKVPLTAQNFLNLAQDGFYDGILFHRVIENFMAQAGDPLTKDPSKEALWGTGGPGYVIADEFLPELKHDSAGIVSMANKGTPKSGGSQFFITHEATPWLDGKHTVFGKVTEGLDVLMNITQGDVINSVSFK
ncbi:MAG: peptidylprolyl isomerase [Pseudomonadales bacterium]|nr:peptidylprolyl isomerase [Pseudomonadales bacterium]